MNIRRTLLCLLSSFLVASCSAEKTPVTGPQAPAEGAKGAALGSPPAGQLALRIVPEAPDRNSSLALRATGFNLYEAEVGWVVNGTPSVYSGFALMTKDLRRGDSVQAKAVAREGEALSAPVRIGNTPPELTRIKIMPEVFNPGDRLWVDVEAADVDGDEVTKVIEWSRNGEAAGTGARLQADVRRGDKITIRITPYDQITYGSTAILTREIGNMPPSISADKNTKFDGKIFSCQLHGLDPDGDRMTFSLKAAPQGMKVDPSTGLVTWPVPADFSGKASFTATVYDGNGGEASQTFYCKISP